MSPRRFTLVQHLPEAHRAFAHDVLSGLSQARKVIPARYFYDSRGSDLFEEIAELKEYYPTRTEVALYEQYGEDMARAFGAGIALVELGSGSSRKTPLILRHLSNPAAYVPVDIAEDFLMRAAKALARDFPHIPVLPVVADFSRPFQLPKTVAQAPRGGFFPGSTIGNFEPAAAARFMDRLGDVLGEGARLLIGVDLKKDASVLERAYDDPTGVTAAFNLNVLVRINRELDGDFDLAAFRHRAHYNADAGRIEMHLVSTKRQRVRVLGHSFDFEEGDHIHTENSYKYTIEEFRLMANIAGWRPSAVWVDADRLFSVHMLERSTPHPAP